MDDDDFIFSLYPRDLVHFKSKTAKTFTATNKKAVTGKISADDTICYFVSFKISDASMSITTHDRRFEIKSLGGKSLLSIEKYQVDVLGNYFPVKLPERRMKFR